MISMIQRLKDVATKSNMNIKLAAGLFYTKKGFVSIGCNSSRTYVDKKIKSSVHAEDAVIRNCRRRFTRIKTSNLKLVVVRINSSNSNLLMSKPCVNCTNIIRDFGVKKIYYINEDQKLICENVDNLCSFHKQFPNLNKTIIWFNELQAKTEPIKTKVNHFSLEMGKKITLLREEKHITQQELALRLSISVTKIIEIEKGTAPYNCHIDSKLKQHLGFY
jgi:DNA-binding XRE family transcriptional regulator/deoxycytidylate deaminase